MWKIITILFTCVLYISYVKAVLAEQSDITDDSAEVLCPIGAKGLQPHPSDCIRFVNCTGGNMRIQQCDPGTAYSVQIQACDFIRNVNCSGREGQKAPSPIQIADIVSCPSTTFGLYPHPYNCTKFIECANGRTYIKDCDPGTGFDSVRLLCDYKHKVKCCSTCIEAGSTLPSTKKSNYSDTDELYNFSNWVNCPNALTAVYPHPFDSTKYLKCIREHLMSESCDLGQAFSLSRRVCSLKEDLNADDYVPNAKTIDGQEWTATGVKAIHGSINGSTYLVCPDGLVGFFLHPFDCTKYIECDETATWTRNCSNGTVFSISRQDCIRKDKVKAYDRVDFIKTEYELQGQCHELMDLEPICIKKVDFDKSVTCDHFAHKSRYVSFCNVGTLRIFEYSD